MDQISDPIMTLFDLSPEAKLSFFLWKKRGRLPKDARREIDEWIKNISPETKDLFRQYDYRPRKIRKEIVNSMIGDCFCVVARG